MKGILKISMILMLVSLSIACSDDEPAKNPMLGSWVLDSYTYVNLPSGYQDYEGNSTARFYGYGGERKHTLTFEEGTYTRTLEFQNDPLYGSNVFSETGEWSMEDDYLNLDPTGDGIGLEEGYDIVSAPGNDLILKTETGDFLYADTLTQAYYDYVWSLFDSTSANYDTVKFYTEIDRILKFVTFDLELDFDVQK